MTPEIQTPISDSERLQAIVSYLTNNEYNNDRDILLELAGVEPWAQPIALQS